MPCVYWYMRHIFLYALGFILSSLIPALGQGSFSDLLKKVDSSQLSEKESLVQEFVEQQNSFPIINEDQVIFLVKGDESEAAALLGDFNSFMNRRYVTDQQLAAMTNIKGTSWHYTTKEFRSDAIVNYKYWINEEAVLDPLNSKQRSNFGEAVSFFTMPDYDSKQEFKPKEGVAKGEVRQEKFQSEALNHERIIHVYLPPGHSDLDNLPLVFFHDGSFHVNEMRVPDIIDQLIARNAMEPVVVVFDDPVIRGKEYQGDSDYRLYVSNELIPYIETKYNTSKKERAVFGFSRGGMSALYLAHNTDIFSKVGAFSPAIHPLSVEDFSAELESFGNRPEEIFITASLYDHIWYPDAPKLRETFISNKVVVHYKEIPMGHNIPSWQTVVDDILDKFY